jgi:hypothetical protein
MQAVLSSFLSFLSFLVLTSTILTSCSSKKEQQEKQILFGSKDYIESYVTQLPSRWFEAPKRFQLINDDNKLAPHKFWDVKPEINLLKNTLNFVVTTPEGSPISYRLDIASGQLYTHQKYCKQRDVWRNFPDAINRPPFTVGVVPRVLDQIAKPQKIIVFGDATYYQKNYLTNYFDARIIGGYIEQECPVGLCTLNKQWRSKMVLVGVQPRNKRFKDVKNLEDLQKIIDWKEVEAFIENGNGRNIVAQKTFPAFRVGSLIDPSQTMSFLKKNSKVFKSKDLLSLKRTCYKLYDFFWANLKGNKKQLSKDKKLKISVNKSLKKSPKKSLEFHHKLTALYKKYGQQFQTCTKYIYATNIQENPKRHWTFAYLGSFAKLYDLGYYYDCKARSWHLNSFVDGKYVVAIEEQLHKCTDRDIDFAFKYAIQILANLKRKAMVSYRYVDYDRGPYGTHNKLYSWVEVPSKKIRCDDNKEQEKLLDFITFPQDIRWQKIKSL